jgi:hypothetical protein
MPPKEHSKDCYGNSNCSGFYPVSLGSITSNRIISIFLVATQGDKARTAIVAVTVYSKKIYFSMLLSPKKKSKLHCLYRYLLSTNWQTFWCSFQLWNWLCVCHAFNVPFSKNTQVKFVNKAKNHLVLSYLFLKRYVMSP